MLNMLTYYWGAHIVGASVFTQTRARAHAHTTLYKFSDVISDHSPYCLLRRNKTGAMLCLRRGHRVILESSEVLIRFKELKIIHS